uniref:NAD(P)-binding domain-containing protein n=1 Tax=Erythrolobus australicus TaxID=1077150 RepID=A0A7S1TL20_9RHOD|mmetsp:Transcript_3332/g.9187  ORF Transcript_3332/g.9187 Transcript_3332/m.9187 type:complete len:483 (+) Transcript_3332:1065-2513(+)
MRSKSPSVALHTTLFTSSAEMRGATTDPNARASASSTKNPDCSASTDTVDEVRLQLSQGARPSSSRVSPLAPTPSCPGANCSDGADNRAPVGSSSARRAPSTLTASARRMPAHTSYTSLPHPLTHSLTHIPFPNASRLRASHHRHSFHPATHSRRHAAALRILWTRHVDMMSTMEHAMVEREVEVGRWVEVEEEEEEERCGAVGMGVGFVGGQGGRAGGASARRETRMCAEARGGPVFVAGASGKTGRRIVAQLLKRGVRVRAGCRNQASAKESVREAARAAQVAEGAVDELVQFVPYEVGADRDGIAAAVGDATAVVSALGDALSFGRVDGFGIAALMRRAAELRDVQQLVVVSSIGVGRPFAFPAAVLNLFGGVLFWKDYSERATRRAARVHNKSFFICRPGGLERAKDDFGETHKLRLAPRNALAGGVVSRLQIAELIATAITHQRAAANKTVEAVAETSAPSVEYATLLSSISTDSEL